MWKVQVRGEPPEGDAPAWDYTKDGPDSWLGKWRDLGIDGSEDYCRGYANGADRNYQHGTHAYRAVPEEP